MLTDETALRERFEKSKAAFASTRLNDLVNPARAWSCTVGTLMLAFAEGYSAGIRDFNEILGEMDNETAGEAAGADVTQALGPTADGGHILPESQMRLVGEASVPLPKMENIDATDSQPDSPDGLEQPSDPVETEEGSKEG